MTAEVDPSSKSVIGLGDEEEGGPIDALPFNARMRIVRMYVQRKSYRDMAKILLAEEGIVVNHVTIYRWCIKHLHSINNQDGRLLEDKITQLQDEAVVMIIEKGLEALRRANLPEIKNFKEFEQVSQAIARTITSKSQVERVKIETTRAVEQLREEYKRAVQRELAGDPVLVEKIHKVLEKATQTFDVQAIDK